MPGSGTLRDLARCSEMHQTSGHEIIETSPDSLLWIKREAVRESCPGPPSSHQDPHRGIRRQANTTTKRGIMTTYHHAKDELDRQILEDEIGLSAPSAAIFRFLLSHMFYKGDSYGWVRDDRSSVDTIAKLTGYGVRTVKEHLPSLERIGLIRRYKRPKATGGRWPDRIFIRWAYVHAEPPAKHDSESAAPALRESPAPSEGAAPATTVESPAPSYIPQEKVKKHYEERGQARASSCTASTPSGEDRAKDSTGPTLTRVERIRLEIDRLLDDYVDEYAKAMPWGLDWDLDRARLDAARAIRGIVSDYGTNKARDRIKANIAFWAEQKGRTASWAATR